MKIGLLLGSFNPITVAHIAMAAAVINSKLCDKVLFVVAKHNPWKKEEPVSFDVRCQMVASAIKPYGDKMEVCRFEENEPFPVFSYISINKAIKTYPNDELYIIAGSDTIKLIPRWKMFNDKIKGKVGFIEIFRNFSEERQHNNLVGVPISFRVKNEGEHKDLGHVPMIEIQRMDISSTMVRRIVENNMNPYPYVTEGVNEIIEKNNLYKK